MIDQLQELSANIQGLIFALTLLDTYPASDRKLTPAIHALHGALEGNVETLCDVVERMDMA